MNAPSRRELPGIGTGSVSLLMIFLVLALTTFAVLSWLTARGDYRLSQRTAQSAVEYYTADLQAQKTLAQLEAVRPQGQEALTNAAAKLGISRQGERFFWDVPVGTRGVLHVEVSYSTPEKPLARKVWKEIPLPLEEAPAGMNIPIQLPG